MFKDWVRFIKVLKAYTLDSIYLSKLPKNRFNASNEVLIIKTDAIGDYILFRNFLKYFKVSPKYKDKRIVLLGNILWKDLALDLDNDSIDEFIWIDISKFKKEKEYRFKILRNLKERDWLEVINPIKSRYIEIDDALARFASSKSKIGREGDLGNMPEFFHRVSANIYNQTIPENTNYIFDFDTNRAFISSICEISIDESYPEIKVNESNLHKNIIIIPGAGESRKKWGASNFAYVINHLPEIYKDYQILFLGGSSDSETAERIAKEISRTYENYCGKTSLPEVAKILANSSLVISNDTGLMHLAAGLKKECICVINGIHLGRFAPYPKEAYWMHFVYPTEVSKEMKSDYSTALKKYKYNTEHHVDEIMPGVVVQKISSIQKI